MLTSALVLKIANLDEIFVVCTDACKQGIGGMLTQNGNVTNHESRNLKEHEHNYATHELELETIVHALNMWRHYLMGKKFELSVCHDGLKYLFKKHSLNEIQIMWMEFLCEYEFDIKHIKGKEKVVYALNRNIHVMYVETIGTGTSYLKYNIIEVNAI